MSGGRALAMTPQAVVLYSDQYGSSLWVGPEAVRVPGWVTSFTAIDAGTADGGWQAILDFRMEDRDRNGGPPLTAATAAAGALIVAGATIEQFDQITTPVGRDVDRHITLTIRGSGSVLCAGEVDSDHLLEWQGAGGLLAGVADILLAPRL